MITTDPAYYWKHPDYYRASPFIDPETGDRIAVWGHGVPTLLPPCSMVALVTYVEGSTFAVRVVKKDDMADLAEAWWQPIDEDYVLLSSCPEDEWQALVKRAADVEVVLPPRRGERYALPASPEAGAGPEKPA